MQKSSDFLRAEKFLSIRAERLRAIGEDVTAHYHEFRIPRPGKDDRVLHIPCGELKQIQRVCLRRLTSSIPLHSAAFGGVAGRSVLDHARAHIGAGYLLTTDIEKFFDNVHHLRVEAGLGRKLGDLDLARELTQLTTLRYCLPQGAPTSTFLGNMVLYGLDLRLHRIARQKGARYTRFVDDIAISASAPSSRLKGLVVATIERFGFKVNQRKTQEHALDEPQVVCGIVVNDRLAISEELRADVLAECAQFAMEGSPQGRQTMAARLRGYVAYLAPFDGSLAEEVRAALGGHTAASGAPRHARGARFRRTCHGCAK